MQLLDATLSLALTLAALATIVTIIMEIGLRAAGARKKNLVETMKLLNKELDNGLFKDLDADERWRFISKVIENPVKGTTDQLSERLESTSSIENLCTSGRAKSRQDTKKITNQDLHDSDGKLTDTELAQLLDRIGYDKSAGNNVICRFLLFVRQFFVDNKRTMLYDKVSLEHVLRRLAEIEKVKFRSVALRKKAKTEFNRLARKYEEYASAVSANFKRSAQAWSVGVGILFAVIANIDGLRIFEAYRTDSDLVNAIIEQQQGLIASYNSIEQRQDEYNKAQVKLNEALAEVTEAKQAIESAEPDSDKGALEVTLKEKEMAYSKAKAKLEGIDTVNQIQQNAEHTQQQLANLVAIGAPIGWAFYPNCIDSASGEKWKSADPRCRSVIDQGQWQQGGSFLQWLFAVVLTGCLMGLAAPFWFDVAKRLAQIRQGFRSRASDEVRMSGNNANGSEKERKRIVRQVVNDITRENRSN
jgi:hypothetical protein